MAKMYSRDIGDMEECKKYMDNARKLQEEEQDQTLDNEEKDNEQAYSSADLPALAPTTAAAPSTPAVPPSIVRLPIAADFSNAIIDRASFKGSSLKGIIFTSAVLMGTSFDGANVENADFSEAYIGNFDARNLCKNPTVRGENPKTGMNTRLRVGGCK